MGAIQARETCFHRNVGAVATTVRVEVYPQNELLVFGLYFPSFDAAL